MLELDLSTAYGNILDQLGDKIDNINWDRIYKGIELILESETKDNFQNEQAPDGTPWAPLKRPRDNSRGGDKILQDTGLLKASFSAQGNFHISRHDGRSMEWGSNLDYASTHQFGNPRENIPARPMVGINDSILDQIEELIAEEVERALTT